MNLLELIIFVVFIVLFFTITYDNIRIRIKNSKLNSEINQYAANYIILSDKMKEMAKKEDKQKVEETEGFLKFVTESREWAFQYIENVQKAIVGLKSASSKLNVPPGSYLLTEELEDIRQAVAEVLRQLPEDSKND